MGILYAKVAGAWQPVAVSGGITQADADTRYVNVTGDTMSGQLVMDPGANISAASSLVSVGNASAATHAMNRQTADARYVNLTGSTMTSSLVMGANPFTGAANGAIFTTDSFFRIANNTQGQSMLWLKLRSPAITAGDRYVSFIRTDNNDIIGSIAIASATAVAYNTTSDYRLKDDRGSIDDASERVQALNPRRVHWKVDPDEDEVDGFFAHEVAEVVPLAVSGEKDAVFEDGSVSPQQLDQSKLIPLLTAALQDALTRIDALEAQLAAT